MASPRIAIIGTGNMGRIHARILNNMRALVAVVDMEISRAQEEAEKYNVRAFANHEDMLEEIELDGVVVSTPTPTHAMIVESIAKRSNGIKGILVEKPLASNLTDAKRVSDLLHSKGISAVVSHSEIYNPVLNRALSLIREGAIGTPRSILHDRRGFVQPQRIPSLGDVFEDIGVHDFDIMTRISNGPAKLYAQCRSTEGIYNSGTVMISFESGGKHIFLLSREYVGRRRNLDVSGTKGTLSLDYFAQIIKVQDLDQEPAADGRALRLPERGATIKVYGEPVAEVIADFIHCIETGDAPRVGLEDGIAALEIVEAVRESVKTGKIIDIDVKARK